MKDFRDALVEFERLLFIAVYGMTVEDAVNARICVKCKGRVLDYSGDLDEKNGIGCYGIEKPYELSDEYRLYGLCQRCFGELVREE